MSLRRGTLPVHTAAVGSRLSLMSCQPLAHVESALCVALWLLIHGDGCRHTLQRQYTASRQKLPRHHLYLGAVG